MHGKKTLICLANTKDVAIIETREDILHQLFYKHAALVILAVHCSLRGVPTKKMN